MKSKPSFEPNDWMAETATRSCCAAAAERERARFGSHCVKTNSGTGSVVAFECSKSLKISVVMEAPSSFEVSVSAESEVNGVSMETVV